MKKNKVLIVANWKMNPGTYKEAEELYRESQASAKKAKNTQVVLCLPYPWLTDFSHRNKGVVSFGAQDVAAEEKGAFTGEVSVKMLVTSGVKYVILGHSERRALGETDELIAKKVNLAVKTGLKVILCVGEKERDAHGEYLMYLRNQLHNSLAKVQKKFLNKIIIAYEPIFSIGKNEGSALQPTDIHETTLFIKKVLSEVYGKEALSIPVLYGGAVGPENAVDIIIHGGVQGLLVGHISLNTKKFGALLGSL